MSSYRNKEWYKSMLSGIVKNEAGRDVRVGTGMDIDKAYKMISLNLERPSFIHEHANAYAAFQEVYGKPYASPQEMKALADKNEIERLREKVEQLEIEKRQAAQNAITERSQTESFEPEAEAPLDISSVLTKEQFKLAHPELKGLAGHHAWTRYAKENGIEK